MAKIIIPQKKTATLELQLDGKDIDIDFRVDSMAGFRKATDVIKGYQEIAGKKGMLKDLTEEQSVEILDQSITLMEAFPEAVRVAIGDEAYNKHLKTVEDNIPITAWVAILSEIISKYAEYFGKITSTEGEL